jgi:catechol 2,3-dioxygenase-like lactoylglutathione lyase family enzyme
MRILGLVFAGSATDRRDEMARFCTDLLRLDPEEVPGGGADFFTLPDGSRFAVADPRGEGETSRTIGFLVDDLDAAVVELRAAGVDVDGPDGNERLRYAHFRAPDGKLYELVENR